MSFFTNNPFYDMLERATSENIPGAEEDIVLNLDIADLIKSKKISAADAVNAFKKKLENSNPNVQLLTIKLLDCCIKNSGNHFLAKVSQREIVDSMATIIRSSITNPELKRVALTYFQNWAIAFRTKPDLYYLPNVYNELKREGHRFPAYTQSDVSGFLIDTETAPEWSDSSVCQRCRTNFTTFNRKHHCRKCGLTFCNDCCNKRIPLPSLGLTNPERVCESCYYKVTNPTYNTPDTPKQSSQNPDASFDFNDSEFYVNDYMDNFDSSNRHAAISSQEEDDIKRAIELSLKEAENNNKHSRNNSSIKRSKTLTEEDKPENSDDEEEQIRKAIEASLKEIKISDNNNNNYNNNTLGGSDSIASSNPDELLTTEIENIKLFSQLMEKISAEAPVKGLQAINDTQIQALHVQISSLHPKVMKNKNYYEEKYKKFNDIHEKLIVAKRLYDQILSQRLDAVRPGSTATYPNLYQSISTQSVQPQPQPQQPYTYTPYSLPPSGMAQPAVTSHEGNVEPTAQPAYINQYPSYLPPSSQSQPPMNYGQAPVASVPPTQPQGVPLQAPPPQPQPQPQQQPPPPQQPQQTTQPIPGQPQLQQPTMIPGQPMTQPQIAGQPPTQDMNLVNKQTLPYGNEYIPSNVPYVPQQQTPYLSMQPNAVSEVQQPPYAMAPGQVAQPQPQQPQPQQPIQQAPPPEPFEEKPLIEL